MWIMFIPFAYCIDDIPPPVDICETKDFSQISNILLDDTYEIKLLNLIKHINKGNMIINDMCEMMDEQTSFFKGSDKPLCRYNASFISNNDVYLYNTSEIVRSFFLKRKQESCRKGDQECGELTIILKLIDIINSVVYITSKVSSSKDLFNNVDSLLFYELFDTYQSSLNDPEILANITLKKDRANLILDRERMRIRQLNSLTYSDNIFNGISFYIGLPIKSSLCYIGNTVGSTIGSLFGSMIEGTANGISVSSENKIIATILVSLYIIKR